MRWAIIQQNRLPIFCDCVEPHCLEALPWRHPVGMRGAKPATIRSLNQPKAIQLSCREEPYGEVPLTTKHRVVRQPFYDRSTNPLPAGEPKGLAIRCDHLTTTTAPLSILSGATQIGA